MSNCFSINQLVGQNISLKKQTKTLAKHKFFAIPFVTTSGLATVSPIYSE